MLLRPYYNNFALLNNVSMKNSIFALAVAALLFASCGGGEHKYTQSEIDAKVDSLVGVKMEEINRQAMEDLDRRMSIEVKAKADSIVQATMQGK